MLSFYKARKRRKDGWEYTLQIPYETDEELDTIIYRDIIQEAASHADMRHCFIETDARSLDDPDRCW